jgi:glycosyltransferase involved in cell wall biosynthesis
MSEQPNRDAFTAHDDLSSTASVPAQGHDLLCFSHLRWDFVFQRPQHLMTRFARDRRVYYIEEPAHDDSVTQGTLRLSRREANLTVVTPILPPGLSESETHFAQKTLIDQLLREENIQSYGSWYYTPMSMAFTAHLRPRFVAYDCMDELSQFKGAPPTMLLMEQRLLDRADVVFTGGASLYDAKRARHRNIHLFPSSIDHAHFSRARTPQPAPADQDALGTPRLGFFGVIDERFDIALIDAVALQRPDWQIVLIGPVVKIDPATLPRHTNIHYLGMKRYDELPAYLAGWDVAILPFARNESTRFISPTKTPEYLAGGKPVVSTAIRDVVHPYADLGLVAIADEADDFVARCSEAMQAPAASWQRNVDAFLALSSWDDTYARMSRLLVDAANEREGAANTGATVSARAS